jgi:NSS family neurotransmitter:Na+ symporter
MGVLSFSVLSEFHPLGNIALFEGKTIFELFVYSVTQVLMPAGGILVAIFAGWIVKKQFSSDELFGGAEPATYKIWLFIVRFVAPVLLSLVLWDVATH